MERGERVIAAAQQVEPLSRPLSSGRKAGAAGRHADQAAQLGGVGVEHVLVGQAQQEAAGHGVPERAAGLDDAASPQFQEARQNTTRILGARGVPGGAISFE